MSRNPDAARTITRLLAARGGNIATMSALIAPVAIAMAAFVIDAGALYGEKRQLQALTDIAAIAGARDIANAEAAVLATLRDNAVDDIVVARVDHALPPVMDQNLVTVETGRYLPDPALDVARRFEAGTGTPNAVRVTVRRLGNRHFGEIFAGRPRIAVVALASTEPRAAFSVGSRLASLNGGILNALLGALTGGEVALTAMDYRGLVDAEVSVLPFLDALATRLDIRAGTYQDVLDANAGVGDIAAALADTGQPSPSLVASLGTIGNAASALEARIPLSHMLDLGEIGRLALGSGAGAFDATVGVMDILTASAVAANGEHQVALDLGAGLPGLASVTAALAIGEPMQRSAWFAIGDHGKLVRTAQTRLALAVRLGGSGLLSAAAINLPIHLEIAYAEAALKRIACPDGSETSASVTVAARPGIAELRIAEISGGGFADFTRPLAFQPAEIVRLPLIGVRGTARVDVSETQPKDLAFSAADIRRRHVRTVSTRDIATSLAASLLNDLDLQVSIAGLDLGLSGAVRSTLAGILTAATPALDTLIYNLTTALGVRIGEADVRVTGVSCGRPVLVQ